jgi:hypothetical protein
MKFDQVIEISRKWLFFLIYWTFLRCILPYWSHTEFFAMTLFLPYQILLLWQGLLVETILKMNFLAKCRPAHFNVHDHQDSCRLAPTPHHSALISCRLHNLLLSTAETIFPTFHKSVAFVGVIYLLQRKYAPVYLPQSN